MMNQFKKYSLILLIPVLLAGCTGNSVTQNSDELKESGIKIVTTFPPLYSFVSNIADESAEITNLVPPGASIHTWEPSASALRELSDADILIMNGLGLEHFINDILESVQNPDLKIVVTSDAVQNELMKSTPMLELEEDSDEHEEEDHDHEGTDPHTWLSPKIAIKQVEAIRDGLIEIDPGKVEIYKANSIAYTTKLQNLDQEIRGWFEDFNKKDFIVFHGAYGYFLKDFDLIQYQKAVIEPFPGKEPTAAYFSSLISLIENQGVKIIFTEPQFNPKVVQNIQEETGAKSFEIDPIGLELSREAYIKNIRSIADAFIKAFNQ